MGAKGGGMGIIGTKVNGWTGLCALAVVLALTAGCASRTHTPRSREYYRGPVSSHFDGERFFNPDGESGTGGAQHDGRKNFLEIALGKAGHHDWPKSVPVHQTVPPRHVQGDDLRVTWIGHATSLIQTQGVNILIDPVWAWRDSPVQLVGPRRVREPGVKLEDLPPIDAILISHNHYDHLDIDALKFLVRRDKARIITGLGNDKLLSYHGLEAWAGDWGSVAPLKPGIDIILTRAHHWSAHWIDDRDRSLWVGFRITLPGGDIYYAGDTGPGDMQWAPEAKGASPVRLALLPIGPYKMTGPQTGNHILPEEAVAAFGQLNAAYALGVHWGTFELGGEPIDDPPLRLRAAMEARHLDPFRFRTLDAGESWMVPALSR
ncbi:MBL fold metallo-hydrolase [Sphingobium sp. BYY-5]|uniref:MBL fold metallo-hydrolase n=1 Tax=Sphingobium sp. BYY-5 TaxID=2926400 RepID=UPI001FA72E4C|nr:MBL fold metallo-hydrolase [Sphingobium sp. BYY-5]MCI4588923.1 MBL fold metallo-hydrolase [Sphingobium sp. BYY-5]